MRTTIGWPWKQPRMIDKSIATSASRPTSGARAGIDGVGVAMITDENAHAILAWTRAAAQVGWLPASGPCQLLTGRARVLRYGRDNVQLRAAT